MLSGTKHSDAYLTPGAYICRMIEVDVKQAISDIRDKYARRLTPTEIDTAISRAMNHTAKKARTRMVREIRTVYNIRAKDARKAMRHIQARPRFLESRIEVTGRPLPAIAFGARQTKAGVSIAVFRGQRKVIKSAFIATMGSGHRGVFARGNYGKGTFAFRRKRVRKGGTDTPITEIHTTAIPQAATHSVIVKHLAAQIKQDFGPRLIHELDRMVTKQSPLPTIPDVQ